MVEIALASLALKETTRCGKVDVAAPSNVGCRTNFLHGSLALSGDSLPSIGANSTSIMEWVG
jgi:hypothetical protein